MCSELKLSIDMLKYLRELKLKIINGASEDYVASRGEYLNGLIPSQEVAQTLLER